MKNYLKSLAVAGALLTSVTVRAQQDPGVRAGAAGAGAPLAGLTKAELAAFNAGLAAFRKVDGVADGLGPRFNLDSCGGCHAAPATGGSSPDVNPQVAVATANGARNSVPAFLAMNGPVRAVRFRRNTDGTRDGGVHALFTVAGRADTPRGCAVPQEDFSNFQNLAFRIPTPLYGLGLLEAIPDSALERNLDANAAAKQQLGIAGHFNRSANDGSISRFGWKAQNKSLLIFSGEAYAVESGVTNDLFPNARTEVPNCPPSASPEDHYNYETGEPGDVHAFTTFIKFLDAPAPAPPNQSISNGAGVFGQLGCAACHTPSLVTGPAATAALDSRRAALYSDLALHDMGTGLADDVVQGAAGPSEWRTAPLWGLGKRRFLLHDGRTADLMEAIEQHASSGSEANAVIGAYRALPARQKQDLLNFLRSL